MPLVGFFTIKPTLTNSTSFTLLRASKDRTRLILNLLDSSRLIRSRRLLSFLRVKALLGPSGHHDLIEFFVSDLLSFPDLALELSDSSHIVSLLLVSLLLGKLPECFVEFLVLIL